MVVCRKDNDILKVGDRISGCTASKKVSTSKLTAFYNSNAYKNTQIAASTSYKNNKTNTNFWVDHSCGPSIDELSIKEALVLRSKFKILIIANPKNFYKTISALVHTLKFKNTILCTSTREAKKLLAKDTFDVVFAENEISNESTHKLSKYTDNLIIINGYTDSQRQNLINAGIKVFPKGVKNAPAMVLKIALTMYDKFLS